MDIKDQVIKKFIEKIKHPAVIAFLLMIGLLILMSLVVDFIRPIPHPTS